MFAMNISIDGCYGHTSFFPDVDLMVYFNQLMQDTGVIVYGRKTYELMIPYWPEVLQTRNDHRPEDIAFAEAMVPIPKIVISRTLKTVSENCTLSSDLPEELLRKLKQQSGKKIALSSTTLLAPMLELGLIDELHLIVHPALVGGEKRLFDDFHSPEKHNFKLVSSQTFRSGVIALHYQK